MNNVKNNDIKKKNPTTPAMLAVRSDFCHYAFRALTPDTQHFITYSRLSRYPADQHILPEAEIIWRESMAGREGGCVGGLVGR